MDEGQDLRVDAYQGSWGGHAQGGAQEQSRQRRHQLHVLFDALDEGALDAARQAFAALVRLDAVLAHDPTMSQIGSALQSSQMHAARYFARVLRARIQTLGANASGPTASAKPAEPHAVAPSAHGKPVAPASRAGLALRQGLHIVDVRA
jgi:hypothetical protein